jgi:nitrogen regulatory protein P-II 2
METVNLKMVTLVAEPVLEEKLTDKLLELGARGFTVTDSRGRGSRGIRASEAPGQSVRIEAVVSAKVADAILEHVSRAFFPNYAVIAWLTSVDVVRGEKYV